MVYHWFILAHNGHDHHPDGDDGDGSDDGDDGGHGDDENMAAIHLQLENAGPNRHSKMALGRQKPPEAWPTSGHNCAK